MTENGLVLEGIARDGQIELAEPLVGELEGILRDHMNFDDALTYLRQYGFGMLGHPDMERMDFLFTRADGQLAFYDDEKQTVEIISDLEDYRDLTIWEARWNYSPASEFGTSVEDVELWDRIKVQPPVNGDDEEGLPNP